VPVVRPPVAKPAAGLAAQPIQKQGGHGALRPEQVLALQQIAGNRSVSRMLAARQAPQVPPGRLQRDDPAPTDGGEPKEEEKTAIPSAIGYLGLNPAAAKEAKALKKVSKDQVMISLDDPKAQKSLKTSEGMGVYIYKKLGIDPTKDMERFIQVFNVLHGTNASAREQMGQMMQWFSKAEAGKFRLERLVFSGHSDGVDLWGDSETDHDPGYFVLHRDMAKVAGLYPAAASQVQDIMFSACWSVLAIEEMTKIFPKVQTVWGYIGFSPSIKKGSAKHIKKWEMTTRGERTPKKRDRRGKAAIWTRAEGYVAGDPADFDKSELINYFNDVAEDVIKMFQGERGLDGSILQEAYSFLQLISNHPDATPEEKKSARQNVDKLLRLRYWDKVTTTFLQVHESDINKAYKGFGVPKITKANVARRSALKKHIAAIEEALAKKEHPDARDFLEKLLRPGLWELSPDILLSTWI
jgi:hypothetical protein